MKLNIDQIRRDGGTQTRDRLDYSTVTDYAEAMTDGTEFPPITVYHDGSEYWLADGFHRVAAAKQIGMVEIEAEVLQGSRRDAILHSVGANTTHGLRRTNADKRRAVETLLRDEEWRQWSDREIARRCSVSNHLVSDIRTLLSESSPRYEQPEERKVERGVTDYTQNTENIGRQSESDPEPERFSREEYVADDEIEEDENDLDEFNLETDVDEAVEDVKRYLDDVLRELHSIQNKHAVVNEILKYTRTLSIEFNQKAV